MNRRGFLQSVSAAIAAVSLPLTGQTKTLPVINAGGRFEFVGPEFWDYGHQVGYALKLPDGRWHGAKTFVTGDPKRTEAELKRALLDWAEWQYRKAA